jgi:superfamily I DNA and/or RNA helicase
VVVETHADAPEPREKYEVAILTGYTAQRKLINRRLNSEIESLQALHIECNTVDAFQGREADIAIYSVTRSNKKGELGFLKKKERLNVALSRGRIGLVIVGDHYFCSTAPHNPLGEVLKHIERHSDSCCLKEANL